jgi:hypothetical protein
MKYFALLSLTLTLSLTSLEVDAGARKTKLTASEAEDQGLDCHFNYESGRYYGSECPVDHPVYVKAPPSRAMQAEMDGADCHFNYESGRYYGSQCPSNTNDIHLRLRGAPVTPSDFRN